VPAAAVIPAPIAYIKVVAVKKLVVEGGGGPCGGPQGSTAGPALMGGWVRCARHARVTVKKLECLKQAWAWIRQHGITRRTVFSCWWEQGNG